MLATLSTIVVGLFRKFIIELVSGVLEGGGPIEALIIVRMQSSSSPSSLERGNCGSSEPEATFPGVVDTNGSVAKFPSGCSKCFNVFLIAYKCDHT